MYWSLFWQVEILNGPAEKDHRKTETNIQKQIKSRIALVFNSICISDWHIGIKLIGPWEISIEF